MGEKSIPHPLIMECSNACVRSHPTGNCRALNMQPRQNKVPQIKPKYYHIANRETSLRLDAAKQRSRILGTRASNAQILMAGLAVGNGHFPPIPTLPGEREKTSKWECNCVRVAPECEACRVPGLLAPATCPNYTRSYDAGPRIILPYVMDTSNVLPLRSWKFYKAPLRLSLSSTWFAGYWRIFFFLFRRDICHWEESWMCVFVFLYLLRVSLLNDSTAQH